MRMISRLSRNLLDVVKKPVSKRATHNRIKVLKLIMRRSNNNKQLTAKESIQSDLSRPKRDSSKLRRSERQTWQAKHKLGITQGVASVNLLTKSNQNGS